MKACLGHISAAITGQKMVLLLFIMFSSSSIIRSDEIITLKNRTHIWCVTDNLKSPICVVPPVPEKAKATSLLIEDDKLWGDGWLLKNSTDVVVSKVADKRWEDFEIIHTNEIHFGSVISISVSHYGGNSHTFTDDVKKTVSRKKRDIFDSWSHSFSTPSENLPPYENRTKRLVPFQFTSKTKEKSYWKIHSYKLRWANTVSHRPLTITISPNDTSCLMVYMYICAHCTLKVEVFGSSQNFHGTYGGMPDDRQDWQHFKIPIHSESQMTLVRSTNDGEPEGYWGIDIRRCPATISNRSVYDVSLENVDQQENRTCSTLEYSSSRNRKSIFSCEPGAFGQKCDMHCEDLLGLENKYCNKLNICDSSLMKSNCLCAWGYQGQFCDSSCSEGTWGLSCQDKCSKCESCNKQTGDCPSSSSLSRCRKGTVIMISLGLGILFFLL